MILYRQKMFISQKYYNKVKRRVQRRAFWGTVGDAAKGGAKNAGKQTLEAIKHPLDTAGGVAKGVGKKIKSSWKQLGATFGLGKEGAEMKTSTRVRNIVHLATPQARRAINIHDSTVHVLGKNGDSVVDSLARFKATPISYAGQKTDEIARLGVLNGMSKVAGETGYAGASAVLGKAQDTAGGAWLGFDANEVAGVMGKAKLSRGGTIAANAAGKVTGYTTGERPGGLFEEIGKAVTKGKEKNVAAEIAEFKSRKKSRRAAQYVDRVWSPWANKIAKKDKEVVGRVASGIDRAGETIGTKARQASGSIVGRIREVFGSRSRQPKLQPVLVRN